MAVNFTGVLNAEVEGLLIGNKDVTNIKLGDGQGGLRALSLTGKVQCEAILSTSSVAEGCA